MVNRNLIRNLDGDDITAELALLAPDEQADEWLLEWLEREQQEYAQGEIVDGRIVEVNDEWTLIDVGFKSEGTVALSEWGAEEDTPKVGDTVKVLIEEMEDELGAADDPYGMISLSKNKAEKIIEWEKIIGEISEGQVVTGTVIRKIKGGLLVGIGVNVFLPGSQVDIRRPGDIGDFIGRVIQAEVLKIDDTRRNIVISRRSLIERQREEDRAYLMQELEVGQIRKGIVKNIADFERRLMDYNVQQELKQELAFNADVIIIALGENAASPKTDEAKAQFKTAFSNLITELKQHGQPRLFVRSQFWQDAEKDQLMKQACENAGGVFIDISKLSSDTANYARAERQIEHAGVAGHPGDKGMQELANALWNAIQKQGTPRN
jgi:hypothetical protein